MSELMSRPKTMVDIYRLLPEGTPIQVINNEFYMSPSPNFQHFDICDRIIETLKAEVKQSKLGRVFFAPIDVFLGSTSAVQPDIFFISNAKKNFIREDGIYGAPDLIVEVLSPGNKNADLLKKKDLYEQHGVQEYYIVEPSDKSVISYFLRNGKYIDQPIQKQCLVSELLQKTLTF